ncbi:hypothetical protein ACSTKZ_08105 [Vibrio parahaemolyticus]
MSNLCYEYQGVKGLKEIAEKVGIPFGALRYRVVMQGMSFEDAIAKGASRNEVCNYEYNGVKGLRNIAQEFNMSFKTLEARVYVQGLSVEEALSKPVQRKTFKCKNGKRKEIKIVKPEQKNKLWNLALGMGGC